MANEKDVIKQFEEVVREIVEQDYAEMQGAERCAMCGEYRQDVEEIDVSSVCTTQICYECKTATESVLRKSLLECFRPALESKNLQYLAVVRGVLESIEYHTNDIRGKLDKHIDDIVFEKEV